jgi:acetolactate synthase-1/2/3 large subunit
MYTTSTAFLEALSEAQVSCIFANFGSDHPGFVEALAEANAEGRPAPQLITCPNEMVGLSAAHGHAMISGRAQAVLVHVECGTQALAGAVHNADKGRAPVLIFAGASPATQDGEHRGSRNEFIQWIQDVHDQRGIVRGYMRYDNEVRSGRNVKQLVHRSMQFAHSDPQGPVYLMGAREVMEEEVPPSEIRIAEWSALSPGALPEEGAARIAEALARARRPLIVTSYLGRSEAAVHELAALCERLGIGVLESVPSRMNFSHLSDLYLGNQWNESSQNQALAEADVVLVIDSDVPWIPTASRPAEDALIFHIDVDPLKSQMPLWYIPSAASFRADAATALRQVASLVGRYAPDEGLIAERRAHYASNAKQRVDQLAARELPVGQGITPCYAMARLRPHLTDDTIVLNEGITNYPVVFDHLARSKPGTMFASGGGSLGWCGGAAIGAKLAAPEREVVVITGDGSYMFSAPSSVHWMARRYATPFLQIVLNNGGWQAPRFSTLAVHPDGYASRAADLGMSFDPPSDYAGIAEAAGGAFACRVERADELDEAIAACLNAVRVEGRCAVLDVRLVEARHS